MYSFCAMYSFRMSFCSVPESRAHGTPCCSATARYMAHNTEAGELMVMETETSPSGIPRKRISISSSEEMGGDGDIAQRNPPEENLHILQRRNGRAALPHLAFAQGVVGVVAHQEIGRASC